jgi:hypothetical protein
MKAILVLLAALFAVTPAAWGQDRPPIGPDRPGVGTSAEPVQRGALHIETGVDYARERKAGEPTEHRTAAALTVRYGLLDSLELRLDGEPVVALRNGVDVTDAGDFSFGVKWRLLEGADGTMRPTLSLFPSVKLPTAPDPIGNERVDVALLGLATWQAGPITVDFNAGLATVAQHHPAGYLLQAILATTVTGDLTDSFKVLGELFYNSPSERDGNDRVGVTAGVSWLITRDLALDGAVITTIAGKGPELRLQAGVSVRFWP